MEGLTIDKKRSRSKPLTPETIKLPDKDSFTSFVKETFGDKGCCICYLDYTILIGKYVNNRFIFYNDIEIEPRFIQRMRLFNKEKELHIWRKNDGFFSGRLRIDEDGNDTDVVDVCQLLWGTDSKAIGEFTRIYEERGTELILPFNIRVNEKDRVFIKTRNYISYKTYDDSHQQAGYTDSRFVAFNNGKDLEVE